MPKGGFGNLIALPLQKEPRDLGRSVLVDANLQQLPDQWAFLENIKPLAQSRIETALTKLGGDRHPLDIAYAAHPERFVRKPPQPPALPTEVWINPPPQSESGPSDSEETTQ